MNEIEFSEIELCDFFFAGDGMFAELFNGLLFRSIKDKFNQDLVNDPNAEEWISSNDLPKPIVRIGVVPGGSTDAVAMSKQYIIFYYLIRYLH